MTAEFLQDALIAEIQHLFTQDIFHDAAGKRTSLAVYRQDLPLLDPSDEEDSQFPYCIVRIMEGEIDNPESAHRITVLLLFGIIDTERDQGGYRSVLHLISRVYERFAKNQVLGKNFVCQFPMKWVLQDEDTYPQFIGGMQLMFHAPAVRIENALT